MKRLLPYVLTAAGLLRPQTTEAQNVPPIPADQLKTSPSSSPTIPTALIIGFTPFVDPNNVSQMIVQATTDPEDGSYHIEKAILDTKKPIKPQLRKLIEKYHPNVVLAMGETNMKTDLEITVEFQGNSHGHAVKPDAVTAENMEKIAKELEKTGMKITRSTDAGIGECNEVVTELLKMLKDKKSELQDAYFFHVSDPAAEHDNIYGNDPYQERQLQKYSLAIPEYVNAVKKALSFIVTGQMEPAPVPFSKLKPVSPHRR